MAKAPPPAEHDQRQDTQPGQVADHTSGQIGMPAGDVQHAGDRERHGGGDQLGPVEAPAGRRHGHRQGRHGLAGDDGPERVEDLRQRRVVAQRPAPVKPPEGGGGFEDGQPRGLEDVTGEPSLAGPSHRSQVPPPGRRPKPLVPADPLDPQRPVELLVRIDERRERQTVRHQLTGLIVSSGSHSQDVGAEGSDFGIGLPQLREEVEAWHSPVVAQQLDHSDPPQAAGQRDRLAVGGPELNVREPFTDPHPAPPSSRGRL